MPFSVDKFGAKYPKGLYYDCKKNSNALMSANAVRARFKSKPSTSDLLVIDKNKNKKLKKHRKVHTKNVRKTDKKLTRPRNKERRHRYLQKVGAPISVPTKQFGARSDVTGKKSWKKLRIIPSVTHRSAWEDKRKRYNESKYAKCERKQNVFWRGEDILLSAEATDRVDRCTVSMTVFGRTLYSKLDRYGSSSFEGVIFGKEISKILDAERSELILTFTAERGNLKTMKRVRIGIDDREHFWIKKKK